MNISPTIEKRKVKYCFFVIFSILLLLLFNKALMAQCTAPEATASVFDTLTCSNATVTLNGSSSTPGVTYNWSGPNGFLSFSQDPVVSLPGKYILTVTTSVGGCTSLDSVEVEEDTVQPDASASVSGMINCTNPSVTIEATTSIPDPSFWWIGPGGFTSTAQQNPTTTVKGGYTLIVTDQGNGCASTATTYVDKDIDPPLVSAYVSGTLTCNTSSVQLTSSSPTPNATFSWEGPDGFTSDIQNPTAEYDGLYTVTATNPDNTCTSNASVNVIADTLKPGVSISASNEVITCTAYNATLYGSSPTIGVNYSWSGPNGYSSTVQNPVVVNQGDYILTITRVSTGCISKDTISIAVNKVRPGATAAPSGQLTCSASSITLQGSASAPIVSYKWLGSGFYSTLQNTPTSNPGTYLLIVTDTDNGCTSSAVTLVQKNTTPPVSVTASNDGTLTCADTTVIITGNSSTSGVTYSWEGPNGYTSDLKSPTINTPGPYTVIVTNPVNGCIATASTNVAQNITPPSSVSASNNGPLTCNILNIDLSGSSGTSGITYSWSGPGNFSSTQQNPEVSIPGTYTVTVTNVTNGCVDSANTIVAQDTVPPADVVAGNNGTLTCIDLSVNLTGSSSTSGVLYNWSGPNGYISTSQNPLVSLPGTYNLTVTDPGNNCTDTASTTLAQDTVKPVAVTAVNDGPFTCVTTSVTLSGNSSTPGVIYYWDGPGSFSSTLQNPVIDTAGTYSLTVTNPVNGCTSTKITTVGQDIQLPSAVNAVNDGPLTCTNTTVTLTGSSVTPGVTYNWTGPNGFTSSSTTPTTADSGKYILTITNPVNGCSVSDSTIIGQDTNLPAAVTASNNGSITCLATSITIIGNSTTSGVTYNWTGPSGFTSSVKNPSVDEPGTYRLTVTDPTNGCFVLDSTVVAENTTLPGNVSAANDGPITCINTTANLSGNSSTTGVSYTWSGPDGFNSFNQNPMVDTSGTYYLTVTDQVNGCFVTTSTVVAKNITEPGVTAGVFDIITCDITSVQMSASSFTIGVEYSWTGPENFSSTEQYPSTSAPGDYTVTTIDPINGCTSSETITVSQDTLPPADVTASVSDTLTCLISSVTLMGSTTTGDVMYSWLGPNGYGTSEQNPVVNNKGNYILTVTNANNGCSSTANVTVEKDSIPPQDVNADVSGMITCTYPKVELTGSSSTPGVTYTWSGPGFTSVLQSDSVSNPGTYTLTVTGPTNGCISIDMVAVDRNITIPQGITTNVSNTLTCITPNATISTSSSTTTVEYEWSGPNGFASNEQAPSVSEPGPYMVTITNTVNGCSTTRTVNVNQNIAIPLEVTASVNGVLTCSNESVTLTGTSTTPGAIFSWTGPDNFASSLVSPIVGDSGQYTLVVTHPTSGCKDTAETIVYQDITPPADVTSMAINNFNCDNFYTTIIGTSTTANVNYHWVGPVPYTSDNAIDFIFAAGTYVLTVTSNSNGCSAIDSVIVTEDYETPDLTAQGATITCTEQTVTITANSSTPNVTYIWSGPGLISSPDVQYPLVNLPGDYTVTVTGPVNGCTNTTMVTVDMDNSAPQLSASVSDTLTCANPSVTLTAISATLNTTITWTGFAGQNPVSISDPGDYIVTALNTVNGCTNQDTVTVLQDTAKPDLSASVNGILTCTETSVNLTATTITPGTTLTWTGYAAGQNPVNASAPGKYYVTALNTINGCTSLDSVIVSQDIQTPDLTAQGATITCSLLSVMITSGSSTPNVEYYWEGMGIFGDPTEQNQLVVLAGDYTVTVTDPANGCTNATTVTVDLDNSPPACNIVTPGSSPDALEDNTISAVLISDVTYLWSISSPNPNWTIVSGADTPELTYHAGDSGTSATISLIVTNNGNGCYSNCQIELTAVSQLKSIEVKGFTEMTIADEKGIHIDAYPNPFTDHVFIEFIPSGDSHVTVELYNANAILYNVFFDNEVRASQDYKVIVEGENMKPGLYYCIIRTNGKVYSLKLLHVK